MKKFLALLLALATLLSLAACNKKTDEENKDQAGDGKDDQQQEQQAPTSFKSLALELWAEEGEADLMTQLQSKLPDLLKAQLLERGYTVDSITVSVNNSAANSLSAVSGGSVHVAWVDSVSYVQNDEGLRAIAGSTMDKQGSNHCGIVCAPPTDAGMALHQKFFNNEEITWDDVNGCKWGVVDPAFNESYNYINVWLTNKFGKGIADLSNVTVYDNPWSVLGAGAAAEVDVMGLIFDDRTTYSALWTMPTDQKNDAGVSGFGHTGHISSEVKVLSKTESYYPYVMAVKAGSDMDNEAFGKALAAAMNKVVFANLDLFPARLQNKPVYITDAKMDAQRAISAK